MKKHIVFIAFLLHSLCSFASSDADKLSTFLENLDGIKAQFVQHTFDGKNTLLQTQKGLVQLKRPNNFRWESTGHYAQLLLSNGTTLWQYDEDLEQVTIQPLDLRLSATPALLLAGNVQDISKEYDVYGERLGKENHFVLIPKRKDALFDRLRLEFDSQKRLLRMVIKDEVGQKTIIRLSDLVIIPQMPDSLFNFSVPHGVDIIRSE